MALAADGLLGELGVTLPALVAPMAGGAGTSELVIAAAQAGSVGFLAGGYRSPEALSEQIAAVRAAGVPLGVNLFAPNTLPVDRAQFARYASAIQPEGERYGLDLAAVEPLEDDDRWAEKLDLLMRDPVELVSFTFAIPDSQTIAALRKAGSRMVQTVTSVAEARAASQAGVDALAVQSASAGGHWGTFTPERPPHVLSLLDLLAEIRQQTELPLIAAGGLGSAEEVAAVLAAGASAAMLGTALLLAEESGTTAAHRAALLDSEPRGTTVTRAFTGRPARGLRNRFIERHESEAPLGYPAVHHLTDSLRKAAAAAGEPELLHLWAGVAYRQARAEPAAQILTRLSQAA
jgi:nitronate monooxygenase